MNKESFTPRKENKVQRSFTIDQDQDHILEKLAIKWDCSKSDVLRNVIEQGVTRLRTVHSVNI